MFSYSLTGLRLPSPGVCSRMDLRTALRVLLGATLVLVSLDGSECVRCFARFHQGQCDDVLGEVGRDDCCQNPKFGYREADGECQSCGPPVWSPWSSWSACSVLCGEGVTQRSRKCFGIGQSECEKAAVVKLQTQPCNGTCCDAKGWSLWLGWSPCSVSCGVGGVRRRQRVCSDRAECHAACGGSSEETQKCPTTGTCPVHGSWSSWSGWSHCSGSCIVEGSDNVTKRRSRTCSNPAPSGDTTPHGNTCPGESAQIERCRELPNCAVDGSWGAWSPPAKCSVTCGEGLQMSTRLCNNPAPRHGGQYCAGPSSKTSACQSPCPVDGFWSGWSSWGECSATCIPEGRAPVRTRHRSCSNPAPSSNPPGNGCQGDSRQTENCNQLPQCQVDGDWTSWSPFTPCPVTCGVGLQESSRVCSNPTPKHGGQPCLGAATRTNVCKTNVHCPVDGVWSDWTTWSQCKFPFGERNIRCKHLGGSQKRERGCLHRAHNGTICNGGALTETRVCYDVTSCPLKGKWNGWEPWTLCQPACGGRSVRLRRRFCKPDYSGYSPTIGRQREVATYHGRPLTDCGAMPDIERQPCLNVPPCP